jgi:hypothetical protein
MIQATEPSTIARIRKPTTWIRSITAPEKIEAVVAANRVKAPQNTPVALSPMNGPITSPIGFAKSIAVCHDSAVGIRPGVHAQ